MHRRHLHPPNAALIRLADGLSHPRFVTRPDRLQGARAHLIDLLAAPDDLPKSLLYDAEMTLPQPSSLRQDYEPAERQRRFGSHGGIGVFLREPHERRDHVRRVMLPQSPDRIEAQLRVLVLQPFHKDRVEVELHVVFLQVQQLLNYRPPALEIQGLPGGREEG